MEAPDATADAIARLHSELRDYAQRVLSAGIEMRELILKYVPDLAAVKRHPAILSSAQYYDLLAPLTKHVDIWQTRYEQVMPNAAGIVEWFKGTGLRPYLEALKPADQAAFLREYEQEVAKAYPTRADGKVLFPFPRLFLVCAV